MLLVTVNGTTGKTSGEIMHALRDLQKIIPLDNFTPAYV